MDYVYTVLGTALVTSGAEYLLKYNLVDYLKDKVVDLIQFIKGKL